MNAGRESTSAPRRQPHPSPHRGRVGGWSALFALTGAPLAWALQSLVNASLAGYACYPHDLPLAAPLWADLTGMALAVEAGAAALCVAAAAAAWANWRRSRSERHGSGHNVVENGDGRTRFLAMAGMMTSGLFLLATAFAALNLVAVPACGG